MESRPFVETANAAGSPALGASGIPMPGASTPTRGAVSTGGLASCKRLFFSCGVSIFMTGAEMSIAVFAMVVKGTKNPIARPAIARTAKKTYRTFIGN